MNHSKIDDALDILKQLQLSEKQQNIRSALTFLALLDLKPDDLWEAVKNPLCGITPMMNFFAKHYGKKYAPNSRETVRRQTIHQFLQALIIVENPDKPDRPTNSGKTVYQITPELLSLLHNYGKKSWKIHLEKYLATYQPQRSRKTYRKRNNTVLVVLPSATNIYLSAGKHNELVRDIHNEFSSRFLKNYVPVYLGDTAKKFIYFDKDLLTGLGVVVNPHGKMPDIIMYDSEQKWVFVIEAVTNHGPIDEKRRNELQKMFAGAKTRVIYITAFADKNTMRKFAADISWESEVWVAEYPDHMIHFDGKRFMGPYEH